MVGMLAIAKIVIEFPESSQAQTPRGDSFQVLEAIAGLAGPVHQECRCDLAAIDCLAQSRAEGQERGVAGRIDRLCGQGFQLRSGRLHDHLGFVAVARCRARNQGESFRSSQASPASASCPTGWRQRSDRKPAAPIRSLFWFADKRRKKPILLRQRSLHPGRCCLGGPPPAHPSTPLDNKPRSLLDRSS